VPHRRGREKGLLQSDSFQRKVVRGEKKMSAPAFTQGDGVRIPRGKEEVHSLRKCGEERKKGTTWGGVR